MDFNRTHGLKKDSDFRKVYKHGKSFANRHLVMYILNNKSENSRIGISVSKKVGKAIIRNSRSRDLQDRMIMHPCSRSFCVALNIIFKKIPALN